MFPDCLNSLDHGVEIGVGEAIAVIREENVLILDVLLHGHEALTYVAPDACIDQCDAPVLGRLAQQFDMCSGLLDDTIRKDVWLVI